MKRRMTFLFPLLLLILLSLAASAAAETPAVKELWVSPTGEKTIDAICWFKPEDGKEYYLFLPGNTDPRSLRIGFTGAESVQLDGRDILPGDAADFLTPGEQFTLVLGKKKYVINVMQGSPGLPAVYITTRSGRHTNIHNNKKNKEPGAMMLVTAEGAVEYDGGLTHIKMRGNSSTTFKKKNYQVKLETGANLLGMGRCRTWILTGNSRDKSLIRNQMTYDMARYSGLQYTPECVQAEVYINNEYMGLYLFGEKVMIDDDRIAITDLEEAMEALNDKDLSSYPFKGEKGTGIGNRKAYRIPNIPEDITGGYLIEFESYDSRYKAEPSAYFTKRKNSIVVKSPEYCSVEQMDYVAAFMQGFEDAIFAKDGNDPKTGKHFDEFVDLASLVNKYLVEEICKNYDGNSSSMFFYKDVDSVSTVAFAGPVWDYDSSYGSYAREDNAKKVLTGKGLWIGNASGGRYWWPALYKQPDFYAAVVQRYEECFLPAVNILLGEAADENGVLLSIREYAEAIRASADMNFTRWPNKKHASTVAQTGYTFDENIEFLISFVTVRRDYLNGLWLGK
ncbi:MAG: hypothetical protein CW338_03930 [Clostridiales bacterium]|nr:hypothetical protein [Clostridiales bacterium]